MKTIITFLILFFTFSALAKISKEDLNKLLQEKETSINHYEKQGARIILGETTGGGRLVPFTKVEVIFTKDEAILKHEIESVTLKDRKTVGGFESLRTAGKYITNEDVVAIIVK